MEKTIKYLENGEYHYATVRSVGDLAQLKTDSKETLVEAINELWNGGGNVDPSKVPNPEGYDKLVQDVADAVKNQQETNQQWIEWKKEEAQLTEERKQAYLQAMKEMQEAIDKAKADAAALGDKTAKLDEQITKTFSDLDTNIQNMHEQLQKEADRMNQELIDTKSDLTKVRTDLQKAQLDNGRIHDELTNINGKFEHKVWQTDLDPLKAQIDRAETSVQQTKDELLGKASREDLDTVTNAVSKLDTQLKETAKGVEISVKKDELGGEIAEALTNKTNILLGTRRFTTNNWTQRDHVEIYSDPWKGFLVAKQNSPIEGIQQAYEAKAGTTYTFSLFAKMDNLDDSNKPQITLAQNNLDTSLDTKIDVWRKDIDDITSDFKRYDLTFTPSEDCTIYPHVISNSNNPIFVCGYQLEIGKELTPWEPNQEDVGDYVEKSEAQFNVYNDKIQALTEKQRQQGDTQEQLRTEVTQTAEGVKQVSESLKNTNGDITKLRGDLERTADHMKSEYETYTNKAVGQISDSTLNLIRNSSFQNKDEDFAQWQNVSAKANVRQDENGLRWVELTQSGLTTDNPQGLTSNYFNVKQGKVTVAVDIKSGDKSSLDNDSVLSLELYNDVKKRVDFYDVSLSQLGLSKELLGDHKVHRGLYRLGIDRNDAKYMTVKALLTRNGDLYFTNFSARLSSIDDGAYEPNPDDINQQILKQNTKIEQNAKEVAIKANSVDVTRNIKDAVNGIQVGGTNLAAGTNQEYTMGYGIPNTIWKDGFAYGTLPTTGGGNEILPQDPHMFWYTLTAGQEYTQTIWFKTDATVKDLKASGITWFTGDGHDYQPATIQRIGPNSYKIFSSYKWPGKNNNDVRLFDISELRQAFDLNTGTYLKFGKLKLEEGNKSTSWSPAHEDTSAEIKSAKDAAIQVASDQINIHVNELSTSFDDKLNKRVNEVKTASEKFTSDGIEQVVTKITNVKGDVDRLGDTVKSAGSRNLLHNTSDRYKTLTGNGYLTQSTASDIYTPTANYHGGDWFTYAATITNNSSKNVTLETWLFDQNKQGLDANSIAPIQLATHSADVYPGEKDKRVSTSFQISGTTWFIRTYVIFDGGGAPNGSQVQVKDERLVEGKLDGSWSPNPDDVDKKIDTQTLESANIDDLRIQGHYFVRNLAGNPIGGWVYVDVTGNNNDRIRQDVYADQNNQHKYRSWNGSRWSDWEQDAYLSDVKTEVTASVKNLGDRVITQVNSVETRVNNKVDNLKAGGDNLIRNGDANAYNATPWENTNFGKHEFYYNGTKNMFVITTSAKTELTSGSNWFPIKAGQQYTLYFNGFMSYNVSSYDVWLLGKKAGADGSWTNSFNVIGGERLSPSRNCIITRTFTVPNDWNNFVAFLRFDNNGSTDGQNSVFFFNEVSLKEGNINVGYSANPDDTIEAIKEVNTKWDVANGQIQGKVTESQVNNILNGKGYATQSWAETMFQMKKNSITLQAVRDNITNGIQNQVNDTRNQINGLQNQFNTQTGINLLKGTADFSGPWFNKNGKGWSYNEDWQPPTSENKSERNNNVVYQDSGHARDGLGQTVELNTGEYTFSMWMWPTLSGNESMNIYVGDSQYGGTAKVNYSGYSYSASQPQNRWILVKTYLTVTQGGKLSIRPELNQASGTIHVASYMLQHGHVENPVWAPAPDDLAPKSIISSINITPDQIKIASNKIVIDGNTDIHGVLRVPEVRLQGKSGMIGLDGNKGIIISSADTLFQTRVTKFGMDFLTTTNGQKEIMGGITTGFSTNNGNLNGISIVLDTQQKLGYPYGGDFFSIGNTTSIANDDNRSWNRAMDYDASGQLHQGGFMWYEKSYLTGEGQNIYVGGVRGNGNSAHDPILIGTHQWDKAAQSNVPQPLITLGYGGTSNSNSGLGLVWNQMKPYGNWDITDVNDIWYDGQHFRFTWVSHPEMMSNASCPAFIRLDNNGAISSGIVFAWGSVWAMGAARGGNIVKILL